MVTVIDCPNIAGAKAPIAPVLNTPLLFVTYLLLFRFFESNIGSHQPGSGVFSMGAMGALAPAILGQSITVTAL